MLERRISGLLEEIRDSAPRHKPSHQANAQRSVLLHEPTHGGNNPQDESAAA